jgi:hypothetical protein
MYSVPDVSIAGFHPHVVSVTEAANRGVPALAREAEHGGGVVAARHGKPVAAVVSMRHLEELRRLEADLREAALILARAATDTGDRVGLHEAIDTPTPSGPRSGSPAPRSRTLQQLARKGDPQVVR